VAVKVFLSWSGPRSRSLAEALREWIHDVIQSTDCFFSSDDIRAGQRWNNEVNTWLTDTDFGVLCVTPENVQSPWLNFEAGALAKRIANDARVVPVTLGFAPSALEEPLKQFNGVSADEAGMKKLVQSLAEIAPGEIDVERAFNRWWPDLETKISEIPPPDRVVEKPKGPEIPEMFSDIMAAVRGLGNDVRRLRPIRLRSTSAEFRVLAHLFENDRLRDDVAHGNRAAMDYLRSELAEASRGPMDDEPPRHISVPEFLERHGIDVSKNEDDGEPRP